MSYISLSGKRKWSVSLVVTWAYMKSQNPPPQWHISSKKITPTQTKVQLLKVLHPLGVIFFQMTTIWLWVIVKYKNIDNFVFNIHSHHVYPSISLCLYAKEYHFSNKNTFGNNHIHWTSFNPTHNSVDFKQSIFF